MDHELKQRLIGAVVVTALCAIFIPMLFDDPVDNSGQLVSELSIPAPLDPGAETADKLPASAEEVLNKSPDPESLSIENPDDAVESTGVAEEVIDEPEKQEGSESLYTESEGYTRDDGSEEDVVEQPLNGAEDIRPKSRSKQAPAEQRLVAETVKSVASKAAQGRDTHVETANESAKAKKVAEALKPATAADGGNVGTHMPEVEQRREPIRPQVKRLDTEAPVTGVSDLGQAQLKPPSSAKSLAAAVAEANKPAAAPKTSSKLVRWYIQLGSFSKKENAMSLWESLHEQGLPASLDTVQTDKGISYRLRLGPELDGKKAAAMKSRLEKQNIKAILISE